VRAHGLQQVDPRLGPDLHPQDRLQGALVSTPLPILHSRRVLTMHGSAAHELKLSRRFMNHVPDECGYV
jgi:hypothetical protein